MEVVNLDLSNIGPVIRCNMSTMNVDSLLSNPDLEIKLTGKPSEPVLEECIPATIIQTLDEDDDCVICYQTLYRPARTECGHSACESCLLHWALTAMETKFSGDSSSEIPSNIAIAVDGIKFKCPTCRTYTQASFDAKRSESLAMRYHEEYASRESEIAANSPLSADDGTKVMVLIVGNSHRKVPPTISPHTGNMREHEWTFFVKASDQDVIEQVEVILHPTYRDERLVMLKSPQLSTTRLAWGSFTIFAGVVLKEGWEWVGEDIVVDSDIDNGRVRDRLPVQWRLDFSGGGSMRTQMLKIKKVRDTIGKNANNVTDGEPLQSSVSEDEDESLGSLAAFMSENEIAQLREVRRLKRKAMKEKSALAKST